MGKNRYTLELAVHPYPVLTIEQVRSLFVQGEPPTDASTKPSLYRVGHQFERDYKVLQQTGVRFAGFYNIAGIIDTKILMEDLHETVKSKTDWPLGLAQLVLRYDLYQEVWSPRARKGKGAFVFMGAHNGGNDAIANLQVLICLMLDPTFGIDYFNCDEEHSMVLANTTMHKYEKQNVSQLLLKPKANSTFLCFDFEGVGVANATSEYGWAWINSNDMRQKAPGERGEDWWPFIHAEHYLDVKWWNHPGSRWTDGNPHGFWAKYGQTNPYHAASGAKPFHDMLQGMINNMVKVIQQPTAIPPPIDAGMARAPPPTSTSQPSSTTIIRSLDINKATSLPPHLRPPRNLRLASSTSLPPHLRAPRNLRLASSTPETVIASPTHSLSPSRRLTGTVIQLAAAPPGLPSSPPMDAGEEDAVDFVPIKYDLSEVDEDQYIECLQWACGDTLEGIKCRKPSSCKGRVKLCPDFNSSKKVGFDVLFLFSRANEF